MKIAVRKNNLGGQILYRSLVPPKKTTSVPCIAKCTTITRLNVIILGFPKTISAIKGHPLYVLRRHILKYEIIWPEDIEPLGQIEIKKKGQQTFEDIFPRSAIKKLHTRGTWLQKAKVVKPAEVPIKMVSSWMQNKKAGVDPDAKNSGLFGEWQTAPYEPAIAENGKVPRNNFGNVDLYQECMLPIGCVWINDLDDFAVVGRVCRKLDIDAAKAVTGFDGQRGFPTTEGYVVCQEFEVRRKFL